MQEAAPKKKIRRYARGALAAAGVGDVSFVPLDDVAATAGLRRDELFALGADAPRNVREIVKRLQNSLQGKVLGFLAVEERRYFVDRTMPRARQRFTESHEIGHDALPWHRQAFWGEDHTTIDPSTKDTLEWEANMFAAELLFGAGRFQTQVNDYAPGLEVPLLLADEYGASIHATIRKFADDNERPIAVLALGRKPSAAGAVPVFGAQCVESQTFRERFGALVDLLPSWVTTTTYPQLAELNALERGRAEECEVVLDTPRGKVKFVAEGFTNGYINLVLLRRKSRVAGRRLRLVDLNGNDLLPTG